MFSPHAKAFAWRYGPVVLVAALVTALSLAPAWLFREVERGLPPLPGLDKLVHAAMYATLAAAGLHALPSAKRARLSATLGVALTAALYGAAMELAQGGFTCSRAMDPFDALANAAGALVCSLAYCACSRRQA